MTIRKLWKTPLKVGDRLHCYWNLASKEKKNDQTVDAVEVVRCKDCKHRIVNEHYSEKGYMILEAICELDTGDFFELGRCAENDEWFCADGERREDG